MYKLLLYVILLLFCQCKRDHSLKEEVTDLLRTEIVIRGDKALAEEPVTLLHIERKGVLKGFMISTPRRLLVAQSDKSDSVYTSGWADKSR